ncbi:MAG: DUF3570 domain-containing protein [Methyloglobulus sp.]|nr:DUF3570 domain-containing protein [Methyloglobulus sp.]
MAAIKKLNRHYGRNDEDCFDLTGFSKSEVLAKTLSLSLHALTAAALILPGLLHQTAQAAADDDEIDFQYSHYQEGKRDQGQATRPFNDGTKDVNLKLPSYRNPIEVEGVRGSARISLTDRVKFAFNYIQDTWSGATPLATAPEHSLKVNQLGNDQNGNPIIVSRATPELTYLDSKNRPYYFNDQGTLLKDKYLHILSYASPETRKQGDFKLTYNWDQAALDIGGGISVENDYESRFANIGGRLDFNQKQTTANAGVSYTNSEINANVNFGGIELLNATRQDWASQIGLTQVINQNAILNLGIGYTRSTGYQANPYKAAVFYYKRNDPYDPSYADYIIGNKVRSEGFTVLEQRPDVRNQWNWSLRWLQYIKPLDAALHFNYSFNLDDWGINAHTFEADWVQPLGKGWTITPRIRYYSQESASFYQPTFVAGGKYDPLNYPYILDKLPNYFSSDQRLSGYGTLSGGISVSKEFAKGIRLDTGIEYYTHQGALKLGGGGEADFADFDSWVANASLKVNLSSVGHGLVHGDSAHGNQHRHPNIPAGVLFGHTLEKAGDVMAGYRYMHGWQAGHFMQGDSNVNEQQILNNSCPGSVRFDEVQQQLYFDGPCTSLPQSMSMNMHMLDLMYAPTDWLTLMLMPQFVDMQMDMYTPDSATTLGHSSHGGGGSHSGHTTQSGGIGDTGMYALVKLFDNSQHHVHITFGLSAPTGDVGIKLKGGIEDLHGPANVDGAYTHYGMQLGSGTWDLKPSLTYTGAFNDWNWGAQVAGTKRLENSNSSGYALGDIFETSLWGGYDLTHWLSTTLRVAYSWQGAIKNHYPYGRKDYVAPDCKQSDYIRADDNNGDGIPDSAAYFHQSEFSSCQIFISTYRRRIDSLDRPSPMDFPQNYGGHYVDVGFGIAATIPDGAFAGHRFAFEWLQPVYTDVNGYQLDRDGALSATWSYGF